MLPVGPTLSRTVTSGDQKPSLEAHLAFPNEKKLASKGILTQFGGSRENFRDSWLLNSNVNPWDNFHHTWENTLANLTTKLAWKNPPDYQALVGEGGCPQFATRLTSGGA